MDYNIENNNQEYVDINLYGSDIDDNIIHEPLELFFQEITIALKTLPGEVWGVKENINLSRYIFNKYVTITQIKNEITNYVSKNCEHSKEFNYNISVETLKNNNGSDLIYIVFTVDLNDPVSNSLKQFVQKFLIGS